VDVCLPDPFLLLLFKNAAGLIERRRKTCVRQKSAVLAIKRAAPLTEEIIQSQDGEALRVSEEFDLCCSFLISPFSHLSNTPSLGVYPCDNCRRQ
jgi:hypothetical protein